MNISQKVSRKLAKAVDVYSEKTVLRIAITSIPYIGSLLDILLSTKGQKIIQARVMQMFKNLEAEMRNVRENTIDKKYLESEEYFDLLLRSVEAAARTRDREKINLYTKILRGAVIIQDRKKFSPEEYLIILSELASREIQVAQIIYGQSEKAPNIDRLLWNREKKLPDLSAHSPSIPKEDLPFILLRLQRTGLIEELIGGFDRVEGTYVITDVFRKIMQYLGERHS